MSAPIPARSLRDAFRALPLWWSSFAYLKRNKLRHFHAAGPTVILGLLAAGTALSRWLTRTLQNALHERLERAVGGEQSTAESAVGNVWSKAAEWGSSHADFLIEWGVFFVALWIKVKAIKYLLITLISPFMSALSSAVKSVETGVPSSFQWHGFLRDILRGLRISLVLLVMELGLGCALWVAGLTLTLFAGPVMVIAGPLLLLASWTVGAYFFGAAVYDAVYEQAGLSWRSSIQAGWAQRGYLLGLGAIFSLIMAVPWAGPYIAAILGPIPCTTAAARLYFGPTPTPSP